LNQWQPYLIAIVIGLLVGIEREKSNSTHSSQHAMGVRTFLLISLLGVMAGGFESLWLSATLTAFALALILVSYFNQTHAQGVNVDRGLTTEFAAGIVFCLSYTAHQSPALSAIIGPVVAMILFSKSSLHRFTHAIKPLELKSALLLLLGGVVVVNLAPDHAIDPWKIFNPRKFGFLVITLGTLEFSSYVLSKLLGRKKGSLVVGFLGGLVSSTAVLLSSARQSAKQPKTWRIHLGAALAAKLAAFIELFLIVALISPSLLKNLVWPLSAALAFGLISLVVVTWKKEAASANINLKSPLDWKGVFRLSFILGGILAAISIAKYWLGDSGTFAISFLTGLFELHGVSLANSTMQKQGFLTAEVASLSILLAVIASLLSKIGISWVISRGIFSRALTGIFLSMIAIIVLVGWLTL